MKKTILGISVIGLITFLLYLPAIKGGFIWDDDSFVTNNPMIKASNGLSRFWASTEPPDYFPLTSTTLWLEWRLWEMNATGYHITNVLLHILSAILLWFILLKLKIPGAWLISFIFAIHPVNVEAVAWITQRKSTLPLVFYLLSIFLFLKFYVKKNWWFYAGSLFAFLLGLLSKTSIIMLPFVLLLCVWWQNKKIERKDVKRVIPFLILAIILSCVTIWFQYNRSIGDDIVRTDGLLSRFACAGWVFGFYIYKIIFPHVLSFVYPRWEINPASFLSYIPLILFLGLIGFLFFKYKKNWSKPFLFGLLYFAITLFPVLGFFNIYFMRYSFVADHWQYQSMIGIVALLVGLGAFVFSKCKANIQGLFIPPLILIMSLLGFQTWKQCHIYKNSEILFHDTIAKDKNCWMANYNLGHFLQDQNRDKEAIKYYLEAMRIQPKNPDPINNIGNIYLKQGKVQEAMDRFRYAIEIKPEFSEGYYNLGCVFLEQKKYEEAMNCFYKAIELQPKNAKAHNNLANALASQGRFHQACVHYEQALKINPKFIDAHINYGIVLKKQKKYEQALKHFSFVLSLAPDHAKALQNVKYISAVLEKEKL